MKHILKSIDTLKGYNEMKRQDFINLDLRNQLNENLEGKWYFENIKNDIKINKHSIIYTCPFYGKKQKYSIEYTTARNGRVVINYDCLNSYGHQRRITLVDFYSPYFDDVSNLLKELIVHIANVNNRF